MLSFRQAFVGAVLVLTVLYFTTHTHPLVSRRSSESRNTEADPNDSINITALPTPITTDGNKAAGSQKLLIDMSQAPLREKLAYQFPYDVEASFPAYIWQTWKFTPASGDFDEKFRASEASWSEKHPTFVHEVITDQVAVHLIRHLYASVPEILTAYNALPIPVLKADFFRYLILLARGGIYSDIDTQALKSAVEWLPESVPKKSIGLIFGIEADPDREDWASWYSRRIQFCQWTLQSKPGHPILREVVANITLTTLQKSKDGLLSNFNSRSVIEFTGPGLWTDVIFGFMNDGRYFDMSTSNGPITWKEFTGITSPKIIGDVVVLPITSFSPGIHQMGAGEYDDSSALVKHGFEGTWKPEDERHIGIIIE
ncbi:alpha 1,6 mannosyltransferase [Blumeria hordei DH14]|uniref:Alpha 1,6 mannosyltransferase n=1 Tax=Blumeria graminis f. sp. hordei (strain DH14) TaxID=546991 RepID=N1J8W4_BLUG1|nr:alpha 1,6 mannosyltransferase [Blumeria hordei DH14]